jgi:AraC-like DNA-binding protein
MYDLCRLAYEICNRLEACPTLSLNTLAKDAGVDRHTAARALRARYFKSFRDLQTTILISIVRQRLSESPSRSIKEIAADIGYAHARSLSRRVRRATGLSPAAYRRPGRRERPA